MSKHEKRRMKNGKRKVNIKLLIIVPLFLIISFFIIIKYNIIQRLVLCCYPITIEKINISVSNNEIEIGENIEINVKIYPENYSKSNFQWHSSNNEIIEIVDGKIIGKSPGKATIYLTDEEIKSNEIEIESLIKIQEITISNMISELRIGDVFKLETIISPDNATYQELQYESSNIDVINIDNSGNLIANSIGSSTISIKDYKSNILEKFNVEVKKKPVEKIELDDTEIVLGKGQTYIINASVTPLEATYRDVEWESSDNNIVKIEDRKITAINTGSATITATTDNGDKKAKCIVIVNKTIPKHSEKFANGNYNIRTGASLDYQIVATTAKYEKIEFLQDFKNGWKKVRNSKGIVGYTLIKDNYYVDEKPAENTSEDLTVTSFHIANVPYLNQFSLGYPTGCEAVSATMLLKYKGYNVSAQNIVDNTKNGSKKYQDINGKWYGANPFKEFVGHPTGGLSKGNYGVFAKPISSAMSVYAGNKVKDISGCSENTLLNYVSKGNPVVVWCVKNAGNLSNGVKWDYEDGSGNFQELVGEHCAVLIGYDENNVYLNDPSAGKNVKQNKNKFISNWKKLYSQAIIVE